MVFNKTTEGFAIGFGILGLVLVGGFIYNRHDSNNNNTEEKYRSPNSYIEDINEAQDKIITDRAKLLNNFPLDQRKNEKLYDDFFAETKRLVGEAGNSSERGGFRRRISKRQKKSKKSKKSRK